MQRRFVFIAVDTYFDLNYHEDHIVSIAERVLFEQARSALKVLETRVDELEKRVLAELLRRSRTEPRNHK